jgi:CHAT domain-containing protein
LKSHDGLKESGPECPSLEEWGLYCANQLPEGRVAELLSHASECAACGGLLADMMDDPEVEIPELKSATPEWQRQMAARLEAETVRNVVPLRRPWYRTRWTAVGAVAAMLLVGIITITSSPVLLWGIGRFSGRPFEYRVSGARHQDVVQVKGATKAEAIHPLLRVTKWAIELRDMLGSTSGQWSRVHARLALFEQNVAGADGNVNTLAAAYKDDTENIELANDYAIALLLRSGYDTRSRQGRDEDVRNAIDVLEKAAEKNDPTTLFNLGLALERRGADTDAAIKAWDRFLALEPSGDWADEARERKKKLQENKQARLDRNKNPGYEESIFQWPRLGFQPPKQDLVAISEKMVADHHDSWLRDFLSKSPPATSKAIAILKPAAEYLRLAKYADAEPLIRLSLAAFSREGNEAGVDFAAYELAYAQQRQGDADGCLATASARFPNIVKKGYHWLEGELGTTMALCRGMRGEFGPSYEGIVAVKAAAEAAGYTNKVLGSYGSLSSYFRQVGSYREALPLDQYVLERYWAGEGIQNNAYQSYYGLATALSKLQYPYAAVSAMAEAVRIAPTAVKAQVLAQYSELLDDLGRTDDATQQMAAALMVLRKQTDPTKFSLDRAYAKVSHARFAARHGGLSRSFAALEEISSRISSLKNPAVETRYWSVLSELYARAGKPKESENALLHLLSLGDTVDATLPSKLNRGTLPREAVQAASHLTDGYIQAGELSEAWRVWTRANRIFTNTQSEKDVARICYGMLPSGPVALISNATGVHKVALAVSPETLVSMRDLRDLVSRPGTSMDQIRQLSRRIHTVLIAPLQKHIKNDRVLDIAALEPFSGVPFAALITPEGRWLADGLQIAYTQPGARTRAPQQLTRDMPLLAVDYLDGSEIMGTSFPPLSAEIAQEIRAAKKTFQRNVTLSGSDASVARVQTGLAESAIFQFSGHAFTLADDAALVLAPGDDARSDRLLWASRLTPDLLKNVRIAILAACSTGRPRTEGQYPGSDMARAFLLAGVPLVVASSWDVDSRSTGELVSRFYERISSGAPPVAALADSAAALRNQPAFGHPYYWAAFSLFRG